jgi:hypothetical protein
MLKDSFKYKIIIVEDNQSDLFLLKQYLNQKIESPKIYDFTLFNEFKSFLKAVFNS